MPSAKALLAPLDEQRVEHPLQGANLLADGGLGHLVNVRRLGKAFRLGQIAEYLQTLNLHKVKE